MKKRMFIVLVFILLSVGYCFSASKSDTAKVNCKDTLMPNVFPDYVVFDRQIPNDNSRDILVFQRKKNLELCNYDSSSAIFILKDQATGYFLNLFDDFLFMDYGTDACPRDLSIFDIKSRKKILTATYQDDPTIIGKDTVSFWIQSGDTNLNKCKNEEWVKHGMSSLVLEEHYLNLKTKSIIKTINWKCVPCN